MKAITAARLARKTYPTSFSRTACSCLEMAMAPLPIAIFLDKERSKIRRVPIGQTRQNRSWAKLFVWLRQAASERKCPANGD
jgi:hypothetical protein